MISPFSYFMHNKKRTMLLSFILTFSVFCISFIVLLINSISVTATKSNTSVFQNFSIANAQNNDLINVEKLDAIKKIPDVGDVYNVFVSSTPIKNVFGTTSSYLIYYNDTAGIQKILDKCNLSLSQGRLPKTNEYELILHEGVLQNKSLSLNDELDGYKVVGTFSGEALIGFGTLNKILENYKSFGMNLDENATALLLFPTSVETLSSMNKGLHEMQISNVQVHTFDTMNALLRSEFSSINTIMFLIIVLVSISLSFAVAALVYTFYLNRYDEFGILHAMGITMRSLRRLITKEVLILMSFSWVLGYILSIIGAVCFDFFVYSKLGQSMPLFTVNSIVFTLPLPLLVGVCTIIPSIAKLSKTDLISVIERR